MRDNNNRNESKLFQTILELRKELAEEEITPKGYNNKIDRLLADVDTDTKNVLKNWNNHLTLVIFSVWNTKNGWLPCSHRTVH